MDENKKRREYISITTSLQHASIISVHIGLIAGFFFYVLDSLFQFESFYFYVHNHLLKLV